MTPSEIREMLAAPFDPDELDFRPGATNKEKTKALAMAYVNVRTVMDRLDEVLGVGGWQATYRPIADGVICSLRVKIDGAWVEHEDVGSFSDQADKGDKLKAAFSDALKRAAIHVGVARYLYSLPKVWCAYDEHRKQLTDKPRLPDWALPRKDALRPSEWHAVEDWKALLKRCESFDDLNRLLPQLGALSQPAKAAAWAETEKFAGSFGLAFDRQAKKFIQPAPKGSAA